MRSVVVQTAVVYSQEELVSRQTQDAYLNKEYHERPFDFNSYERDGYYANTNPRLAKRILEELVQYKNMIGAADREYREARSLLEGWTSKEAREKDGPRRSRGDRGGDRGGRR